MSDRNKSHSATSTQTAEELIQNIQKLMAEVESVISSGGEAVTEGATSRLARPCASASCAAVAGSDEPLPWLSCSQIEQAWWNCSGWPGES